MYAGLPVNSFARWRHGFRYGNAAHLQAPRGISRSHNEHFFGGAFTQGVRYGGGALQHHSIHEPAGGEYRRDVLHRQRSPLRHLPALVEAITAFVC